MKDLLEILENKFFVSFFYLLDPYPMEFYPELDPDLRTVHFKSMRIHNTTVYRFGIATYLKQPPKTGKIFVTY